MKRFAALSALLLFSSITPAQDVPSVPVKSDVAPTSTEDARMKALEEQVRSLAGEVALLRVELKELRESKSPQQSSGPQVLLASSHPELGMLASPPAQLAQTQTYGGATSNAKLLHPDINFVGAFTCTASANTHSPARP